MSRKYSFEVANGVDSAMRVIATLRRKQFLIKEFSMEALNENQTVLHITLENDAAFLDKAVPHVEKLVDVSHMKEEVTAC